MTRQSFRHERVVATTMPVAVAMVEGGAVGVLAKKAFGVGDLAFATILAAPMFANITSFFWARLARGRRKVPFLTGLATLLMIAIASIGLLPRPEAAAEAGAEQWLLVGLVVLCRCLLAGITTIRSSVWRHNYPRQVRSTVTGRLIIAMSVLLGVAPTLGYLVLDWRVEAFRVLYPATAAVGLIGAVAFSRVRLRRERELLAYERSLGATPTKHGGRGGVYEYDEDDADAGPAANVFSVLKRDALFRRYMTAQFLSGVGNMMTEVALITLVIRLTEGQRLEYTASIIFTVAVPMLMTVACLPLWSRYLDRVHIAEYRTRHGLTWLCAMTGYWALGYLVVAHGWSLWVLLLPRVVHGVGRAGGMIAWQLGHNDFADRRLVATYMGIHVTLTGVRGAIGPYLAIALLDGWTRRAVLGVELPAWDGIGVHIFGLTLAITLVGYTLFVLLHRTINAAPSAAAVAD